MFGQLSRQYSGSYKVSMAGITLCDSHHTRRRGLEWLVSFMVSLPGHYTDRPLKFCPRLVCRCYALLPRCYLSTSLPPSQSKVKQNMITLKQVEYRGAFLPFDCFLTKFLLLFPHKNWETSVLLVYIWLIFLSFLWKISQIFNTTKLGKENPDSVSGILSDLAIHV